MAKDFLGIRWVSHYGAPRAIEETWQEYCDFLQRESEHPVLSGLTLAGWSGQQSIAAATPPAATSPTEAEE